MAWFQETLYEALAADPTLASIVEDRIYPGEIPDDEDPTPWLFFSVPDSIPFEDLGGDVTDEIHTTEFHAWADTYAHA